MTKRRANPRDPIWNDGPTLFAFLESFGFMKPETTADGITYTKPDTQIMIRYFGPREAQVHTTVMHTAADGTTGWASLICLYVACGYGVPQDIPTNAPNQRIAAKRVLEQASALRRILPHLLTDEIQHLVRRCQGRLLPSP